MKNLIKVLLVLSFAYLPYSSTSQTFDGVFIGGDFNECINKLKLKKYKLIHVADNNLAAVFEGVYNYQKIQLFVLSTPTTKKAFSFTLFMPKENTFETLESDFSKLYEIFYDKHGEPDLFKSEFLTPYVKGDGYEITALKLERAKIEATWFDKSNKSITIEISSSCQIKITYTNHKLSLQNVAEYREIDKAAY